MSEVFLFFTKSSDSKKIKYMLLNLFRREVFCAQVTQNETCVPNQWAYTWKIAVQPTNQLVQTYSPSNWRSLKSMKTSVCSILNVIPPPNAYTHKLYSTRLYMWTNVKRTDHLSFFYILYHLPAAYLLDIWYTNAGSGAGASNNFHIWDQMSELK